MLEELQRNLASQQQTASFSEQQISFSSLEDRIHGPFSSPAVEDTLLFHREHTSLLPYHQQQDQQQSYTLGPLSLSAQPPTFSQQQTLQLQVSSFPLPFKTLSFAQPSDESPSFSSGYVSRSLSFFQEEWQVTGDRPRDGGEEQDIPLGKLGRLLRKYLLEDSDHPVAQTYRNTMKSLAKLSDGPTQWLFGERSNSSIDFRLGTEKAGMYWKVTFGSSDRFILGYEQAVTSGDTSAKDGGTALFLTYVHTIR